jgi:hypothetical protein
VIPKKDYVPIDNPDRDPEEYLNPASPTNKDKPEINPGKRDFPEGKKPKDKKLTSKKGKKGKKDKPTPPGPDNEDTPYNKG